MYAYDVVDWPAHHRRKLIDVGEGTPDGMRCDVDGGLWMDGMGSELTAW